MSVAVLERPAVEYGNEFRPSLIEDGLFELIDGVEKQKTVGTVQNLIAAQMLFLVKRLAGGSGFSVMENLFVLDQNRKLMRRPDFAFVSKSSWLGVPAEDERMGCDSELGS